MPESEEKKRPEYKHNKGKCNNKDCKYYMAGYCKITGAYVTTRTLSNPMMMGKKKEAADCEPFLIDLRQDAKADWPGYQMEPEAVIDESVGEQILKELQKISERLGAFYKNFKKYQEDERLRDS